MNIEETDFSGAIKRGGFAPERLPRRRQQPAGGRSGFTRAGRQAIIACLAEIGYDGALTSSFVAPIDRTPANPFPDAIETEPVDISPEEMQFIIDHGSSLLSESFYLDAKSSATARRSCRSSREMKIARVGARWLRRQSRTNDNTSRTSAVSPASTWRSSRSRPTTAPSGGVRAKPRSAAPVRAPRSWQSSNTNSIRRSCGATRPASTRCGSRCTTKHADVHAATLPAG